MIRQALARLGRSGVLGLGLLLFALVFWLGEIVPARQRLAEQAEAQARLQASPPTSASPAPATAGTELPSLMQATRLLKDLGQAADRHGVTADRASFSLSEKGGQGRGERPSERRLEIALPLRGDYPSLRAYLRDVLDAPQAPALDELLLQRPQAGEPLIQASLRLSYRLAPGP